VFLGHSTFTADDLAAYRGPKPQGEQTVSLAELNEAATWIRQRSHQLRHECGQKGLTYVDIGELGFEVAIWEARCHLAAGSRLALKPQTEALRRAGSAAGLPGVLPGEDGCTRS
jgi:hypothetical protein